jgi:conjugative transfer signal peptidase TraF
MMVSGRVHPENLMLWTCIAIMSVTFPSVLAYAFGLRINMSRSLPMGLYAITGDGSGELIEFCPDGKAAEESKARAYRSTGSCLDGAEPLIKPVIAQEGDVVEFSAQGISVNGTLLKNTAPLTVDAIGRPLTPWRFGMYKVAHGQVWVASTHNYGSYDSRYFGPVRVPSIRNRLCPVWILH